jgi:hypothetical protein
MAVIISMNTTVVQHKFSHVQILNLTNIPPTVTTHDIERWQHMRIVITSRIADWAKVAMSGLKPDTEKKKSIEVYVTSINY